MASSREVAEVAGINPRQLDYWRRKGWVWATQVDPVTGQPGSGPGCPCDYSDDQVAMAVRIAELVGDGFPPSMAAAVARGEAPHPDDAKAEAARQARRERARHRVEARKAALDKLALIHSTTYRYLYNEELHRRGVLTAPAFRRLGGVA